MTTNVKILEFIRRKKLKPEKCIYLSSLDVIYNDPKANGPLNLLKNDSSIYHSVSGTDKWVSFDFAISPLYLSGFILTSSQNRDPLNWVLEGSNDTITYKTVYTNQGEKLCPELINNNGIQMCAHHYSKEYTLNNPTIYTSYRIRNTGMSTGDSGYLILSAVEFIGHFTDFPILTCYHYSKIDRNFLIILILVIIFDPNKKSNINK